MHKAYTEIQAATFEFQDFREKKPRPTAEEVIDQAVGKKVKTSSDDSGSRRSLGLLSRIAAQTPAAGVIYPRSTHAPSSSSTSIPVDDTTSTQAPTAPPTPSGSNPPEGSNPDAGSNPSPETGSNPSDGRHPALSAQLYKTDQIVYSLRGNNHVFIVDHKKHECFFS